MPNRVASPCTFPGCGGRGVFAGRCHRHKRGGTVQRGYGTEHKRTRALYDIAVKQGRAVCWRCKQPILPDEDWDLGHSDTDRSVYMGPEHSHCNRSAASKLRHA